jgi:hypothetical protein
MGKRWIHMANAGEVLRKFYSAVVKRDLNTARNYLADDLTFVGLFETYQGTEEYLKALAGLLQITLRLDVKKIIAEGSDAAVFFKLQPRLLRKPRFWSQNGISSKTERSFTSSQLSMADHMPLCSPARWP